MAPAPSPDKVDTWIFIPPMMMVGGGELSGFVKASTFALQKKVLFEKIKDTTLKEYFIPSVPTPFVKDCGSFSNDQIVIKSTHSSLVNLQWKQSTNRL